MKSLKDTNNHYSLKHRILSWSVLIGIFICGVMVGAIHWGNKPVNTADSGASTAEEIEKFVERNNMPCRVKEETLLQMLTDDAHSHNARVYEKLVQIGCEQNKEKYANFAISERELAEAMNYVRSRC